MEMMLISIVIIAALLAPYAGFLCYLLIMLFVPSRPRRAVPPGDGRLPGVSVVIPFRNEANHLPTLIGSLASQTYRGPIEILLVNDGSADNYPEALASAPLLKHAAKVIDSHYSADRDLTSKQQALDLGIARSSYELIALTDADMLLKPDWLERLVETSAAGADLAFGHTVIQAEGDSGFFAWFQSFQLELLFAIAYAFHKAGIQGSCMGNNMLFSRKAYDEAGGYEKIGYSLVEDRDLFAAFRKKGMRTAATEPFHASAITFHCTTVPRYYHQLLRWTYGGFRINSNLSVFGLFTAGFIALLFLSLIGMLPASITPFIYSGLILTWIFVAAAFRKIDSKENALLFLPFFGMLLGESVFLMLSLLIKQPVRWKERRI